MNAIQTLGDAVSKLGKQINDLQREVAGRRSHAHRLSIELKQSEIEREKLESSLGELRSSVDSERDEIEQELQLANDAITRLQESNNALSADCNARQQQVIQATAEIDRMRKELPNGKPAEGIVVRPMTPVASGSGRPLGFKIINRNYKDT